MTRFLSLLLLIMCVGCLSACSDSDDNGGGGSADAVADSGGFILPDTTSEDTGGGEPLDCPGGELCPCDDNDDCDNNLCIEGVEGKVCAKACVTDCPEGYKCSAVNVSGGDVLTICTLAWGRLCDPCQASSDCKSLGAQDAACVDHGANGTYCGATCAVDDDCPTDHRCAEVKTVEGAQVKQCLPKSADGSAGPGLCTCSARAKKLQLKTTCSVDNIGGGGEVLGTCFGERVCETAGLSDCKVPPAAKEVCDGLDNDCNGVTDDKACDDDNPCTQDICDPKVEANGGCSNTDAALPCDADGNACTEGDTCENGVCKPGAIKECDDKNPCTIDSCDPKSGCVKKNDDGKPCDDENPCTVGDDCQEGSCSGGKPKVCVTTDPCVNAKCSVVDGKCKYSNKQDGEFCDDNSACTTADICQSNNCTGKPVSCDDSNSCTLDGCAPATGCQHKPGNEGSSCEDGNACTTGGKCSGGTCGGGSPKKCNDGDPCTTDSCDQASNKCKFEPKIGCGGWCKVAKDCPDDNNVCTTAVCNAPSGGATAGKCGTKSNSLTCDDGNACTKGDVCSGGQCKGIGKDCNDNNPCTADNCDPTTQICSNPPNTAPCDDGNPCTSNDACSAGSCKAGTPICKLGDNCKGAGDCITGACVDGKCVAPNKCGLLNKSSTGKLGNVTLLGTATINGDTGAIIDNGKEVVAAGAAGVELHNQQASGAPGLRVFHFDSLTIAQTAKVKVTGSYGVALLAKGAMVVNGELRLDGTNGTAGGTNVGGKGGAGGPGGSNGGTWQSKGCVAGNGTATGPGGGPAGQCGGPGSKGGQGVGGGGGGGGGGGCGGSGGAGGSFADPAGAGAAGSAAGAATAGQGSGAGGAVPGLAGGHCSGVPGSTGPGNPYGDGAGQAIWGGAGGGGGGFGGFAGFGGAAKASSAQAAGGQPGYSGGAGGGGGGGGAALLCAGSELTITGTVSARGGNGGSGGSSGISQSGKGGPFNVTTKIGGGGGGGRSGGGGGGGGGSGGYIMLISPSIKAASGVIDASGGLGGSKGFAFSGASGGFGKNGGSAGGKGGSGGVGGVGGKGSLGRVRVMSNSPGLGQVQGKLTQGGL